MLTHLKGLKIDLRNENDLQFLFVFLISTFLSFNFSFGYILASGFSFLLLLRSFLLKNNKNDSKKLATPMAFFALHLIWALPYFLEHRSFSIFEKYLPLLFFPLTLASLNIDKPKIKWIVHGFIFSIIVSYTLSLITAAYRYFHTPPPWGRPSDFFFHEQFSEGLFGLHPTYYSLLGCLATLLAFYTIDNKRRRMLIILIVTFFILLLNAKITLLLQIVIVFYEYTREFYKQYRTKGILLGVLSLCIIFFSIRIVNSIYDYPHRKLIVDLNLAWLRSSEKNISDADGGFVSRMAIWRHSVDVIGDNLLLGVGLGYERDFLLEKYKQASVPFLIEYSFDSHNQILSYLITFGILGFVPLLFLGGSWLTSATRTKNWLYLKFLMIFFVCCLTESLLNRLAGVSIFAFFNSLLSLNIFDKDE